MSCFIKEKRKEPCPMDSRNGSWVLFGECSGKQLRIKENNLALPPAKHPGKALGATRLPELWKSLKAEEVMLSEWDFFAAFA